MSEPSLEMPVAELKEVHLSFPDKEVLRGTSLSVRRQERLVILGQSGSGKSTILRLLLGILKPTSGVVKIQGDDLSRMGRRRLNECRQKIGMVYQYSALISSLTVKENLQLPLEELTDKPRGEIEAIVAEKLGWVGMGESAERMPSELSGGMRKRVALARALVLEPELILYDEPTAGLDPVIGAVIDELLIALSERLQATSIIVTHEMGSAFKVATRLAMLYEGRIVLEGGAEEFRQSGHPVVEQFIHAQSHGPMHEGHA